MFVVAASYPLDDEWEERDSVIYKKAGRKSDGSSAGSSEGGKPAVREHVWEVKTFEEAQKIKKGLENLAKVSIVIREKISHAPAP